LFVVTPVRSCRLSSQFEKGTVFCSDLTVTIQQQGIVDALIAQHPNDIGRIGAKMAVDYLKTNKELAKKTVKTGLSVVTRNNVSYPASSVQLPAMSAVSVISYAP
jgi:ABC-type sugar transport system substrate-binding protein